MQIFNRKIAGEWIIAGLLLVVMASLMLHQAKVKTTIFDESAHIVSGYSYVAEQDYRLNPEHPPLIKAAAGVPLLFQDLNFPDEHPAWTEQVNGQWVLGDQFLHWSGNDPTSITFWSRIGPIVLTLIFGVFLFIWARKLYGAIAGIFALSLFVFSPTILAHGSLVTTDVGAALGFFFATYFFFKYLKDQSRKNLIWAGVAFGIAQLLKFSLILLIPFFTIVAVLWVLFKDKPLNLWSWFTVQRILKYFGKLILIGIIGLIIVYPVYQFTILNYPAERQLSDTQEILSNSPYPTLAEGVEWMADKPVLRAYGQFFMGHLMVFQRVSGGNTVYFLGDVSSEAWLQYFPVVYGLKIPLAFLVMLALAASIVIKAKCRQLKYSTRGLPRLKGRFKKALHVYSEWMSKYFTEIALGIFVVMYWVISIFSNLNIGVRHVIPTFPFIFLIVTGIFSRWIHGKKTGVQNQNPLRALGEFIKTLFRQWTRGAIVILLLLWYVLTPLSVHPDELAFFNAIAGGPENGHKYVVDSNLDWGQDLGGLAEFIEKENIENIKVAHFGGGNPAYYLGDAYEPLDPFDESQRTGWIAVSATLLQGGRGEAVKGFDQSTTHYTWLNEHEPVTRIGYSIFVYHIE